MLPHETTSKPTALDRPGAHDADRAVHAVRRRHEAHEDQPVVDGTKQLGYPESSIVWIIYLRDARLRSLIPFRRISA
jgi:hypothetical protein